MAGEKGANTATISRRILLLDDDPDGVTLLAMRLRADGHKVEYATNPLYALTMAKEFHPEFAFIDIGLPYMDGYTTLEKLKRHFHAARFFALTGRVGEDARQKSLDAGFEQHLVKPIDFAVIQKILES